MNAASLARRFLSGLVGILILVACVPSAPPAAVVPAPLPTAAPEPMPSGVLVTQAEKNTGIWQVDDQHCQKGFMIIRPDATYTWSCRQDGSAGVYGRYSLENGRFLTQNDFCASRRQYEARILQENGQPKAPAFTMVKDDCPDVEEHLTRQLALWVAPLP